MQKICLPSTDATGDPEPPGEQLFPLFLLSASVGNSLCATCRTLGKRAALFNSGVARAGGYQFYEAFESHTC